MPPYRILSCPKSMHSSYPWNAFMGVGSPKSCAQRRTRTGSTSSGSWPNTSQNVENEILGFVCVLWGWGFCLPCYKAEASEQRGRFARLHVFGVATGPLRMCVVVCMHEHHLLSERVERKPRFPLPRKRGLPFVIVSDGPGPSCLVPPLLP